MKKTFDKKLILGIIIGGIIIGSIGVGATTYIYNSNQVSYGESNVKGALDELYGEINEIKKSELVTGTASATSTDATGTYVPNKAFDGNLSTSWYTRWSAGESPVTSADLYYEFNRNVSINGLKYIPTPNVISVTAYYSTDGTNFTQIGTSTTNVINEWSQFIIPTPIQAKKIKLSVVGSSQMGINEVSISGY